MIEDPWYSFQLLYNLHQLYQLQGIVHLRFPSKYIDEYHDGLTKYYLLETFDIESNKVQLCLGLSPNWRY
ncbi:hypothetical protein D3C71_2240710 [compost metagenome]